jgi:shikimate kinase/3-dehydroquinate synthase
MIDLGTRHLALIGFMGAGKTTVARELSRLLGRPFVDSDAELERSLGSSIPELFAEHGEPWFREQEHLLIRELLRADKPAVVALGGGAVGHAGTRTDLEERARVAHVDESVDVCWRRVAASDRPLARDRATFRELYATRKPLYAALADAEGKGSTELLLGFGQIHVETGCYARLPDLIPGEEPFVLVADEAVLELHPPPPSDRLANIYPIPSGERAKSVEVCQSLWDDLQADRSTQLAALGGGTATDAAGFVAATYMRGLAGWIPVPSTLVGQVDAAIGGKTGIDLAKGKNLVGAFNLPSRVVIDPALLKTLPDAQLLEGRAEVVKTGLLVGRPLWDLDLTDQVRACAAFKTAVCLSDPQEAGRRAILNLGHTFAHGLEAAGGYSGPTHGQAVALGLRAALQLSIDELGLDPGVLAQLEHALPAEPVSIDGDAAWAAMAHDKKAKGGVLRLVLLEAMGKPVYGVELEPALVRAALDSLIVP